MKTVPIPLPAANDRRTAILEQADRFAQENGLAKKRALQLRLLAEEMASVVPGAAPEAQGVFWMENEGSSYRLHAVLEGCAADDEQREMLLALSSSGRNAAEGFGERLRRALRAARGREPRRRDELERSMIANLADDVAVALQGRRAEITIQKNFWE